MRIIIIFITACLIFAGCSATKETTTETTTVQIKDVKVPIPAVNNEQTIPYDTVSESWTENSVTPAGDTVKTKITELVNVKQPDSKPALKVVQKIIPAPVIYKDTTSVTKTKSTQIVKQANPIMVALGNFTAWVLKFLFWIIFGAVIITGIIYAAKKGLIKIFIESLFK